MKNSLPRLLFAAPASGVGKTTVVTGLLQALVHRGLRPAAFKCGPDYIDPMFHREVLGIPGRNLDLHLAPPAIVRGLLRQGSEDADIAVLEGVMGYYDGVDATDRASSHHLATETATPAVLILRPRGAFLSVAAMLRGFLDFRRPSGISAVIFNRCDESLHQKLRPVVEKECGIPVLGFLPDLPGAHIESRHLGLTTPEAVDGLREKIAAVASRIHDSLDISALLALARTAPVLTDTLPRPQPAAGTPVRIAVARDAAFCFYYRENLELLRACGAEPIFFSPLRDTILPENIGGVYLGGGYPELHAAALAANTAMRQGMLAAIRQGMPTVAECGGFLYLQSILKAPDGSEHPMVGALSGVGENGGRLRHFGYTRLRALKDTLLLRKGEELPAHEFHYWSSDNPGDACIAAKGETSWPCVAAPGNVFAGFPHLYFWSEPKLARRFVAAAAAWKGRARCRH